MTGQRGSRFAWLLLPRPVRNLPADLAAILAVTVLAILSALLPVVHKTPVRIVVALPFLLFAPGYALVAALIPESGGSDLEGTNSGINPIERIALSVGLSIAVVPLIGLTLNFTPAAIRLIPILLGVGGFTITTTVFAAWRRWKLPQEERLSIPYKTWLRTGYRELRHPATSIDRILTVGLIVSVILAVGSVGYAVSAPTESESFTEFYLLTEGKNGSLTAEDYPKEFVSGSGKSMVVGVNNHEYQPSQYTVVIVIQRVRSSSLSTRVMAEQELYRLQTPRLEHNESWQRQHQVNPTMSGHRLRLQYLLYRGTVPENPTIETAYREAHLWINVSNGIDRTEA
ncbi:DUF1616 domain-containing protein [Haloarculaceae archaeon H-GB11]|nr:DUF1616 domain-containing protein [Haloarculaceae archaeon H-GB1-1]MEA5388488.1 DUF1616 domain-containing protein [Haloarculaceae archaeon H-GB11]